MTDAAEGDEAIPYHALENAFVRLEPLQDDHRDDLARAASDPRIWRHTALTGGSFATYWDDARCEQATGAQLPFAVRVRKTGALVGMSRLFRIDPEHLTCEIGYTWYSPAVWGSAVNPAAKRLLLGHCFEAWSARRVQFLVDHLNERSQAAVERLGAKREGVLRAHRIRPDGSRRDSVVFSIIAAEWPEVRTALDARLAKATS